VAEEPQRPQLCDCSGGECYLAEAEDVSGIDRAYLSLASGRRCFANEVKAMIRKRANLPAPLAPLGDVEEPPPGVMGDNIPDEGLAVDPNLTVAEAERAERERQEAALRAKAMEPPTEPPYGKDFEPTGALQVWIGFDHQGRQQIRYAWDKSLTNTMILGIARFLDARVTRAMVDQEDISG